MARSVWDVNCFILELVLDCHPEVTISSPVRRRCRQPLLMGCLGQFHVQASPVPTMGTPSPTSPEWVPLSLNDFHSESRLPSAAGPLWKPSRLCHLRLGEGWPLLRQAFVSADQLCSLDRWAVTRGQVWAGECRFWTTCACLGREGKRRGTAPQALPRLSNYLCSLRSW